MRHYQHTADARASSLHSALAWGRGRPLTRAVRSRVIPAHRESLEERLYEDGFLHIRDLLCADLVRACSGHELFDSGEL